MKLSRILACFLLLLAVVLSKGVAPLQAGTPTLVLNAPSETQLTTEPIEVRVEITGAASLSAWEFDVEYDQSLVQVIGLTLDSFVGATASCDADTGRCAVALGPQEQGAATSVGAYSYGAGAGGSGDGLLAVLHLQPTGANGRTPLQITNALAIEDGVPIEVQTQDATVVIGEPTGITLDSIEAFPATDNIPGTSEMISLLDNLGLSGKASLLLFTAAFLLLFGGALPRRKSLWRWYKRMANRLHKLLSIILLMAMVGNLLLPVAASAMPLPAPTVPVQAPRALESTVAHPFQPALNRSVAQQAPNCFAADLNCDNAVDEADFALVAQSWRCQTGDVCYQAGYDFDNNGKLNIIDIDAVTKELDTEGPQITIMTPAEGATSNSSTLQVNGTVTDRHAITSITVNDVDATLSGEQFSANIPLDAGNQVITVMASDEVGAVTLATRMVARDSDGPEITVNAPRDRQSVYSRQPTIDLSYNDFYDSVDSASLSVQLVHQNGTSTAITGDLTVTNSGAQGTVSTPLVEDSTYTLTVSLADNLGNTNTANTTFYIPPNADNITPPDESESAGWISGVIYDSTTCTEHLTECDGLAGVQVTLESVDTEALQQVREARQREIERRWQTRNRQAFTPLPPMTKEDVDFTTALDGTIVTGPDGFFAFPVSETGSYWLRAEKEGYTYGQREAEIVLERSSATNAIYVTPIDPAMTPCDENGCSHTSDDGQMTVDIPAGAIPSGDDVEVTATEFDQVEFLPSGDLPPGTWETYAFNLGGSSDYEFEQPITVKLKNSQGFAPGTEIPLGYWNQHTQAWEHEGTATVDATGEWVVMQLTHFSNHDPNYPTSQGDSGGNGDDNDDDEESCKAGEFGCFISVKTGTFEEDVTLPTVNVLGEEMAPTLRYNSNRANPSDVIDFEFSLNPDSGVQLGDYIAFEFYIEGLRTDRFVFSNTVQIGEVGRFRYLWDGHNAQGELMASGVYSYTAKFSVPYQAEYCGTVDGLFGSPPDCENRATGVFVEATDDIWVEGTVELDTQPNSALGAGWVLDDLQRLYENEAGHILVTDGQRKDEFYFPQKDLLNGENQVSAASLTASSSSLVPEAPSMALYEPPFAPHKEAEVNGDLEHADRVISEYTAPLDLPASKAPKLEVLPPYSETPAQQGMQVCGDITSDTVWTAATGTYQVTCDINVTNGVTLTIEPGVIVQFEHSDDDLIISGILQAIGTEANPIFFQPMAGTTPGSWGRVAFLSGSSGTLDHTVLEYGGQNVAEGLLYLASDEVQVTNSIVRYSANTGIVVAQASPLISSTQILSNTTAFGTPSGEVYSSPGGGLYIYSGNPIIQNNTFQGNSSSGNGGGIYNISGNPTIQNNTFRGNSANNGGGLYNDFGNPTIENNIFQENSALFSGGGIYTFGNPTIEKNTFQANSAKDGGGLYNQSSDTIVEKNTFQGNSANANGGGIYTSGNPTIHNNTFRNNSAETASGGGIYNTSDSPTIENNILQDNAASDGGGLYNDSGNPTIQNNTFQGNSASSDGGALYNSNGRPTMQNNIIADNTANNRGGGIFAVGGFPKLDYNNVWNNSGGDYEGLAPGSNDISADPMFVDAPNGDFHLLPNSPNIDAGDPDHSSGIDFEDDLRPMGRAPDIGADEFRTLGIQKSSSSDTVGRGDTLTYTVQLVNLESASATSVTVTDVLPNEVAFQSYDADELTCTHDGSSWGGRVQCTPNSLDLPSGASMALTLTVVASDTLPAPMHLTNVITATANSTALLARDQASTWVSWCNVQLNDGPIGTDIQAAINVSTQESDVVRVSGRCLLHDITLDKTLTLQGGWNRDFSVRDSTVHTTTLDAQQMGRVISVGSLASPTIEGFVITGGLTNQSGGGIHNNGNSIIQNNAFQGNSASGGGGLFNAGDSSIQNNTFQGNLATEGGAFYNFCDITIQNNIFLGNSARDGGAILNAGSPSIQNNTFQGNSANNSGGGIASFTVVPGPLTPLNCNNSGNNPFIIQNNIFQSNSAETGGGVYGRDETIQNNIFQSNSANSHGGGIFGGSSINNTFYGNSARTGGGISTFGGSTIHNNILANNTATFGGGIFSQSSTADVDYNNVWNNTGGDYQGIMPGANDISADPLFVDAEGGDFHLSPNSPCIDAGNPENYPETDFEGDPRPLVFGPDIGADEVMSQVSYARSRTSTDYSQLRWDLGANTYSRLYLDGTQVHFDTQGRHHYTLEPDGRKTIYTYNDDDSVATMAIIPPGESTPSWTWTFNYTNGKLSSITDPAGRDTLFTVDAQGDLTQITMPDGATQHFAYDANHLPTHYIDENGEVTTHTFDRFGRITSLTEPPRTVYNSETGQTEVIQEVRHFTPSDTSYHLINDSMVGDPENPAPSVPKSEQLVDRVVYGRGERNGHTNKWGSWVDETDGEGRTTFYERDERNNLTRQTYPDGDCVEFTYDGNGNVRTSDRMGGQQCTQARAARDPSQVQSWIYTYEERFNQIKTETDPLGNTTTYFYDYEDAPAVGEAGNLIRAEYPMVEDHSGQPITPTVSYTYNALGLLETETDIEGTITKYVYTQGTADEASSGANPLFASGVTPVPGLLTQVIEDVGDNSHLNLTTTFKDFDGAGNPLTWVNPRGAATSYTYDELGRVLTSQNALGFVTKYEYDERGNLISLVEGYTSDDTTGRNRVTTYTYDADDRLLTLRTEADGIVWELINTYDINGQLATQSDNQGRTITYSYDDADQLIAETDALGQSTSYTYSPRGELATITYPDGRVVSFDYDERSNLTSLTPPSQPAHTFEHTLRDLGSTYAPPDVGAGNNNTLYSYNAFQQLTEVTRPDNQQIAFAYDSATRLHSLTVPRGTYSYSYDPATSQVSAIAAPSGVNLTYSYDGDVMNQMAWTGSVNGTVGFTYDNHYRITQETINGSNPIAYQYTNDHLLTQAGDLSLTYLPQSGLLDRTTLGNVSDALAYNAFGEPVGYNATANSANLYTVEWTYDQLARIRRKTETTGGQTHVYDYTYDVSGRLTQVEQDGTIIATYTYDGNGNRLTFTDAGGTTTNGTVDDQDRLLTYGATSYSYTANGELATKTTSGQTTTYDYDVLGNLMAVTLPDGTQIEYLIDGENRRIGKKTGGTLTQGFLYQDDLNPIAELDGSNNIVSRFIYASQAYVPDVMIKSGTTYRIISDHLGSVRLVVNTQTGEIAQRMDYDAFGQVTQDTNPGFQPFGFAGGLYDTDTGLVRFGARDYDAETGRWTAKDPIRFDGGDTNLYVYVGNDPMNFVDIVGMAKQKACKQQCTNQGLAKVHRTRMLYEWQNSQSTAELVMISLQGPPKKPQDFFSISNTLYSSLYGNHYGALKDLEKIAYQFRICVSLCPDEDFSSFPPPSQFDESSSQPNDSPENQSCRQESEPSLPIPEPKPEPPLPIPEFKPEPPLHCVRIIRGGQPGVEIVCFPR